MTISICWDISIFLHQSLRKVLRRSTWRSRNVTSWRKGGQGEDNRRTRQQVKNWEWQPVEVWIYLATGNVENSVGDLNLYVSSYLSTLWKIFQRWFTPTITSIDEHPKANVYTMIEILKSGSTFTNWSYPSKRVYEIRKLPNTGKEGWRRTVVKLFTTETPRSGKKNGDLWKS